MKLPFKSDIMAINQIYGLTEKRKIVTCPGIDRRPVFEERLCDGFRDCANGEDEDKVCRFTRTTQNDCCGKILIPNSKVTCEADGLFNGADIYKCDNEFNYIYKVDNDFVIGFLADPRLMSQKAWSHSSPATNNCPNFSTKWQGKNSEVSVACENRLDSARTGFDYVCAQIL